jgi:hypothetical protein
MPYVISGNSIEDRTVVIDPPLEIYRAFYGPIARGETLTPEILNLKPDPYYVQAPSRGNMPEIFGEELGVWTVKDCVKNIIERLEPGVHSFIPINLRTKDLNKDYGSFYLLCPGQAINAIYIEETDFIDGRGRDAFERSPTLSPFGIVTLCDDMIDGRHLWLAARGRFGKLTPFEGYLFCSDDLEKCIKQADIEGWCFRRCELKRRTQSQ